MTGKRILVVDDEESIRFTFETFLIEEGYQVTTACSYSEASSHIVTGQFDLIFLDVILEGGSGMDLLRQIKHLKLSCATVMMSGYPGFEMLMDAERLGAAAFLPKPVSQAQLLGIAKEMLELQP